MSLFSRSFAGYRFHGLAISTMVHGAAVCVLLLTSAGAWHVFETSAAREARVLHVAASASKTDEAVKTPSITVSDPVRMTGAMVRDRIEESLDQARRRSDVENLDHLERMGMNAEDGQRVYETMQRIRQNPLLEQVYRKIAMPLFDQMLNTTRGLSMPQDAWQSEP